MIFDTSPERHLPHTLIKSDHVNVLQALLETPLHSGNEKLLQALLETSLHSGNEKLLQALLETPLHSGNELLRPVSLYSANQLRVRVLRDYMQLRRFNRFNALLLATERLLIASSLVVLGYWFADGPVRDWLHEIQGHSVLTLPSTKLSAANMPARSLLYPTLPPHLPLSTPESLKPTPEADYLTPQQMFLPAQSEADLPDAQPVRLPSPPVGDYLAPQQMIVPVPDDVSTVPTWLTIPSIEINTPVIQVFYVDGEWQPIDYAAGYLYGTGDLGEQGNVVIAGHAGLRGGVFYSLPWLQTGDDIFIDTEGWRFHYRVREQKVVWPEQTEVLYAGPTATLTLMTCANWDLQRLVVIADLVGDQPLP